MQFAKRSHASLLAPEALVVQVLQAYGLVICKGRCDRRHEDARCGTSALWVKMDTSVHTPKDFLHTTGAESSITFRYPHPPLILTNSGVFGY